MSGENKIPDQHNYPHVMFYASTLRFYLDALKYYSEQLAGDFKGINEDPQLSKLLNQEVLNSFPFSKEVDRIKRLSDWIEKSLANDTSNSPYYDIELTISHGTTRLIKSAVILYLRHLEKRRNEIGKSRKLSRLALEALDTRLAQLRETISMGVFEDAEEYPLLIEDLNTESHNNKKNEILVESLPPAKIASSIELIDTQLRERCLDLFNDFDQNAQHHRFDTVISEATRILEDRIRKLSGAGSDLEGARLVTFAFVGNPARLKLGNTPAEQEAAQNIFRGTFGFIRNPFHHSLIEKVEKERILQILGMVDYLIYLTESAERSHL